MSDRTNQCIEYERQYCAQNYHPLPVVLTHGEGVWIWDLEGKRYLDMMSAYSAVSFGHAHSRLVKALSEQAQTLAVTSRAFYTNTLGPFLAKLCQMSQMDMALPMNTGVEAVETALKAARRWGYEKKEIPLEKAEIIVAKNNFHGRTLSVISFSSEAAYQKNFGPFTPGFVEIPFGDVQALQKAITAHTCAFLVEPIQGEAGLHVPPEGWLKACQEICARENVLFILDEIQSGLGRTGRLFAFEHEDARPDGLIVGKALGGGLLPVSAFLARREVMEVFSVGSHGSTFGGNPLAARVALEALNILAEEDLIQRSATLGELLLSELRAIKSPLIKEVRGKGLWVGVEIAKQPISARQICEKLLERGILAKDVHQTVIRLAPPLVIERETLLWAIEQFQEVIRLLS